MAIISDTAKFSGSENLADKTVIRKVELNLNYLGKLNRQMRTQDETVNHLLG